MGSEADAEAAAAVDSDGSVSWEDFFGTSTDLVPQLLGMFDELARRGNGCADHVLLPSSCNIPAAIQKRLSLVPHSHRGSIFGPLCSTDSTAQHEGPTMDDPEAQETLDSSEAKGTVSANDDTKTVNENPNRDTNALHESRNNDEKPLYRRETSGLTPLRYSRRSRAGGRPLSGSSIASSTSSSGCSNQGNPCAVNPYLASVESLADTCASSQGSGDSGVVTVLEAGCRVGDGGSVQRRDSAEREPPMYQNRPRYCDPHRNPVERVLLEIVDTEAVYVEHLRQVIQGYLIFWRDDPASLMDQLQLSDLFSNMEDIYEFNREFLKEIEECGLDPVSVANTFIKHNSGFKVYTEYCTNYPRTVAVLTDLMGQEVTAKAFRERQAALRHALPLGSFLLKPVQRILKYHLLLQNLSKEYDAGSEGNDSEIGRTAIEGALAAMTGIAKHINAMKRRHEHAVRVQEIQSLLYGWPGPDLTTSGELVAEGRFRMRGAKAPRHAFLFDRMLLLTKKKEDGLLVYKAHILCSNLMLIESIPGEPFSFHVIPFDNPRQQYTLQARNLEQKREWTMQIKRVILENYNAVIPSHARQLVMQLGQTQPEDDALADRGSAKKQHSAPPEYLEKRKQEKERRKSETGFRQRLKKGRKSEPNTTATEDSPAAPRKNQSVESIIHGSRDRSLNRSADGRSSKVKDRFASWRRKSEPGFQSYVSLNQSDDEQKDCEIGIDAMTIEIEPTMLPDDTDDPTSQPRNNSSPPPETKDNGQQAQAQTVEEIVGHILMQNREFQKLLEKQRTNSIINVRQQQRFNKHILPETSDDSEDGNTNFMTDATNNNRGARTRSTRREHRLVRANNARNSSSPTPPRDDHPALRLRYDNLRANAEKTSSTETIAKNRTNRIHEKRALFEAFKRQSIVTDSKVIQTALRIRENSSPENENVQESTLDESVDVEEPKEEQMSEQNSETTKGFGNYDNLQRVWEGVQDERVAADGNDSPTRPAVWLTKLCEGLPTQTQKCGSLPRSFQIHPHPHPHVTKARFLQRDGKPMSERPFTIASDKPAEINMEDMERYASSCQPEDRIAKFPTSTSTFFYSLDDAFTDAYSELNIATTTTNVHPDHKIYRANGTGSTMFKNVLSKAGSRLQGLRATVSTETLECSDESERSKQFRSSPSGSKSKKKSKSKSSRESSSDVEEIVGCVAGGTASPSRVPLTIPSLYYKQGSSGMGARIAQSDYADPATLFAENKRAESAVGISEINRPMEEGEDKSVENIERRENEADSFYEKSFETIENYVDAEVDNVFRDSAIFSDMDEVISVQASPNSSLRKIPPAKPKVAPPVPVKRKPEIDSPFKTSGETTKAKPNVAHKPDYLKIRARIREREAVRGELECSSAIKLSGTSETVYRCTSEIRQSREEKKVVVAVSEERDDVSAGQSRAGWVRKMVGQLQGHVET